MKTSPYLVILFLKILVVTQLFAVADGQFFSTRSRSRHRQQQQQQQQPFDLNRNTQPRPQQPRGEVFFVNLEDGFFGCQVNASVDVLQLFEISKLCDGTPQCYLGSDEQNEKLKCTSKLTSACSCFRSEKTAKYQ